MLARVLALAIGMAATPAWARVIASSETGVVFADTNCRFTSGNPSHSVSISLGDFDYLEAKVDLIYTCVTHDGRRWTRHGGDIVQFLTPQFNWETQDWEVNGTWVAHRVDDWQIELNPNLKLSLMLERQDVAITFHVNFETIPATP